MHALHDGPRSRTERKLVALDENSRTCPIFLDL